VLPVKAKKLEGLKASQDTTRAKVAPNRSSDLLGPRRPARNEHKTRKTDFGTSSKNLRACGALQAGRLRFQQIT